MNIDDLNLETLSPEDREKLLILCFKWIQGEGGFVPPSVFGERLRTFPTVYVEMITFYQDPSGGYEVLLDMHLPDHQFSPDWYGTQGHTLMMQQTLEDSFRQYVEEYKIPFVQNEQPRYAGTVHAPFIRRDHPVVIVFFRVIHEKPDNYGGTFVPMAEYPTAPILPSCRAYVDLALDVLSGAAPEFREHLEKGGD